METTIATLPPRRSTDAADVHDNRARPITLKFMHRTVVGLVALVRQAVDTVRAYRERRAAYRQLTALDPRALHDMGISPGDIDAIAGGRFTDDGSRCRKHFVLQLNDPAPAASWLERARPGIRPTLSACPEHV